MIKLLSGVTVEVGFYTEIFYETLSIIIYVGTHSLKFSYFPFFFYRPLLRWKLPLLLWCFDKLRVAR